MEKINDFGSGCRNERSPSDTLFYFLSRSFFELESSKLSVSLLSLSVSDSVSSVNWELLSVSNASSDLIILKIVSLQLVYSGSSAGHVFFLERSQTKILLTL